MKHLFTWKAQKAPMSYLDFPDRKSQLQQDLHNIGNFTLGKNDKLNYFQQRHCHIMKVLVAPLLLCGWQRKAQFSLLYACINIHARIYTYAHHCTIGNFASFKIQATQQGTGKPGMPLPGFPWDVIWQKITRCDSCEQQEDPFDKLKIDHF